jgi:Amt family ammonium transporter
VGVYSSNGLYHERQFPFYFATSLIVPILFTGSMAERVRLEPLLGFVLLMNAFIYPISMSWAWNLQGGFLRDLGFFDRGGSVIIFQSGAIAGIIGAIILGPRYGRFMTKNDQERITSSSKTNTKKKTLPMILEEV